MRDSSPFVPFGNRSLQATSCAHELEGRGRNDEQDAGMMIEFGLPSLAALL
jgi:hypothetical protein